MPIIDATLVTNTDMSVAWERKKIAAPVIAKGEDGLWTDVWIYDSAEQAEAANAKAADMPEFGRMAAVSEVLSIDMAWMPVG